MRSTRPKKRGRKTAQERARVPEFPSELESLPLPSLASVIRGVPNYGEPDDRITYSVAKLVRAGMFPDVACRAMGIPRHVARQWLERGIEEQSLADSPYAKFLRAIDTADAQGEYADIVAITKGTRHWAAIAWKRERRSPTRWGARSTLHVDVDQIQRSELTPTDEEAASVLAVLSQYIQLPPATAAEGEKEDVQENQQ